MSEKLYAVIDVETTGKGINGNRITEICIVLLQGNIIVDKFTSLVNPECNIPPFITGLTGIDNDMVRNAPRFHEIAERIVQMTTGAIFVAHNVNFDYNVIKGEFKNLGYSFVRKKLCTVRLSRKLIPGMFSYSLGKLCSSLNIPLEHRHRAEGDTDATVILFQRILSLDPEFTVINKFLNVRSKEATLPPHLQVESIDALPEETGIYLFKDQKGKVIYAGKAKNIKQRVVSHFYDKKNKEYALCQATYNIDYEVTGNELVALLLESEKIQKHFPKFNRAQKRPVAPYGIIYYTNRKGVIQLAIDRSHTIDHSVEIFYSRAEAVEKLEQLCTDYELCPRYCSLQSTTERCSHYKIKNCKGICESNESVALYNMRVQKALASLRRNQKSYLIKERGRTFEEQSFVMIQDGVYKGFGFVNENEQITSIEDCENFLQLQKHTYHTTKIIKSYLRKNGERNIINIGIS
ncbi:exonuclease domain-containing protein [Aquimarina sp. 2201CG14-23]|uniref:exonuclease domain-containing protein n=1 Tax=Aquimarina mycalae TaxID=3040073 RepID=UPI00247817E8|nr:exonuclease domain-containing protein [Aquimarina sp. 2201CG14-23]MDH7444839.1 exonuclease domain-containing protein [Aquimarina sp. 2201CG14-23]